MTLKTIAWFAAAALVLITWGLAIVLLISIAQAVPGVR